MSCYLFFFFFKQKTAYEMRISDWSSDVCSSDLKVAALLPQTPLLPLEIDGRTIWCKAECLQPVGAFKIRGAWHRLTDLSPEQANEGVVGVSSRSEERRVGKE